MNIGTEIRVPGVDEHEHEHEHSTIELGRVIAQIEPPEIEGDQAFDVIVRFADGAIDKCDSRQFLNLILVAG
jgi:hypothetical protein